MNENNMFSSWFESLILKTLEKYFDRFTELAEQRIAKPTFIKQKNVPKYYDDISLDTLKKYEDLGLKRCEPIEGGNVYYKATELDRFMVLYSDDKEVHQTNQEG